MPSNKKLLQAAAGNAGESLYVEDVFSTYLYEGTSASHPISNGIDLSAEGGMVWIKNRTSANWNVVEDTNRGATKTIYTNSTNAEATQAQHITSFNSDGFTAGTDNDTNLSGENYASWSFRKQAGFFDVVTWSGDGVQGREIAHDLAANVGTLIIKKTNNVGSWYVWHRSQPGKFARLETTTQFATDTGTVFGNGSTAIAPTSNSFTVDTLLNEVGDDYVAYVFAHDDQSFGDNSDESIIKCGSYTGTSANGNAIDLGWEPQYLIIRNVTTARNWLLFDSMRGLVNSGNDQALFPNLSSGESPSGYVLDPVANGFIVGGSDLEINSTGNTYIYIAIRRPMKTPESGTEVFTPTFGSGSGFNFTAGFPVDMAIIKDKDGVVTPYASARLNSGTLLSTASTAAEFANAPAVFDSQVGYYESSLGSNYIGWLFKRATGFFDVVAYTGTGSQKNESHNLGVTPELMIVKSRSNAGKWSVYESGLGIGTSNGLALNQNSGTDFNNTTLWVQAPTSSVFTLGTDTDTNGSGYTYIAYLFATLAGISKVGSYTGTGSNVDVDCGFTSGARFILIKRAAGIGLTGDWYVYDSVRGIVSGNDPFLLINTTDAENTSTDYIDPLPSGFTVTSSAPTALNNSGDNYIFLAIA